MHPTFSRALSRPIQVEMLVALSDWTLFASYARSQSSDEAFSVLDEFYLLTENVIDSAGGVVLKFMGDAALVIFPEDLADIGVMALLDLKRQTDSWFQAHVMPNRLHVNAHFGQVTLGPMGYKRNAGRYRRHGKYHRYPGSEDVWPHGAGFPLSEPRAPAAVPPLHATDPVPGRAGSLR